MSVFFARYIRINFRCRIPLSGNCPGLLLAFIMDKIIALTESSPQGVSIDEAQFVRFMQTTPIWEFFKITQQKYLSYTKEEETKLINDYYIGMQQGKSKNLSIFCSKSGISGEFRLILKLIHLMVRKSNIFIFLGPSSQSVVGFDSPLKNLL